MKNRTMSPQSKAPECNPRADELNWTVLADLGTHYLVEMPLATWIGIPGHPRQRDTKRHARKGHWKFLRNARGPMLTELRSVVAGELDGRVCKLDGHTRALLWQKRTLPPPRKIYATVYRCKTRDELNDVYTTFDTQTAAESLFERVAAACREQGIELKSRRLKGGTFADALSIAMTGAAKTKKASEEVVFDVYEAVRRFAPEIDALDRLEPPPEIFQTGIIAAALLATSISTTHAAYFKRLASGAGMEKDGLSDPVEIMRKFITSIRSPRRDTANGERERADEKQSAWTKDIQTRLCAHCLSAVMLFEQGESAPNYWSAEAPEAADLLAFVTKARERKLDALRV